MLMRLVIRFAASLVGIAAGLLLAGATSRLVAAMLFGVTTTDLFTYAGVLILAVPLAAIAATGPALRAAHVDPLVALRAE